MSALITQCLGDTVQTGTRKVDPARKFKCTTAARETSTEPENLELVHPKGKERKFGKERKGKERRKREKRMNIVNNISVLLSYYMSDGIMNTKTQLN